MTATLSLPERQEWTVDDLVALPKDLRYELIDGRLILPAPLPFHQFVCRQAANAMEVDCPDDILISFDQSVAIDGRNQPRPDVVAIREEGASRTPVLVQDVLLAVEVISPDSSIRDRRDKLKLYAQGKIPAYWVIDPLGERVTFTEFVLDGDRGYRRSLVTDGSATVEDPWKIALDLPSWTRRRNRLRDVARPAD